MYVFENTYLVCVLDLQQAIPNISVSFTKIQRACSTFFSSKKLPVLYAILTYIGSMVIKPIFSIIYCVSMKEGSFWQKLDIKLTGTKTAYLSWRMLFRGKGSSISNSFHYDLNGFMKFFFIFFLLLIFCSFVCNYRRTDLPTNGLMASCLNPCRHMVVSYQLILKV